MTGSRSVLKPLPMSVEEMSARGWDQVDVVFVTGDGYVDHPSFATALLGRWLEKNGYRVAVLAQPDWKSCEAWRKFGKPRLCFAISSGNMDSMVNHYTANRKVRNVDAYTPGGKIGMRPDRASAVYCQRAREAFPGVPVVLGGVEASLRRVAHYDYWSDKVRRSVLLDSKADILSFGMGERSLLEIVRRLDAGQSVAEMRDIPGTAYRLGASEFLTKNEAEESVLDESRLPENTAILPTTEEVTEDKAKFAEMTKTIYEEMNPFSGRALFQQSGTEAIIVNPPSKPLSTEEMDEIYALPFTRREHPSYGDARIPALQTVRDSIQAVRGCYGGCSFCSIGAHEGKVIQNRSKESLIEEVKRMTEDVHFTGTITDIGGPTANMYGTGCGNPDAQKVCKRTSCLYPSVCANLKTSHREYLEVLKEVREQAGVKNVFIASGIRTDLAQSAPEYAEFMRELVAHHVGGHLSVAPEHVSSCVLSVMHKPEIEEFDKFVTDFDNMTDELEKNFYTVPYFIASHPGCRLEDMVELAEYMKMYGYQPEQVQDFYPTPFSVATCMYYSGLDPFTGEKVYSAHGDRERKMQRALMQYFKPENYYLVREALEKVGRTDLIGDEPECLIHRYAPKKTEKVERASASGGGYRQRSREENAVMEQRAFQRARNQEGARGFESPHGRRDRDDRNERSDRNDRGNRNGGERRFSDRGSRFSDRNDRDRGDRFERRNREERGSRFNRSDRGDRGDRFERNDRNGGERRFSDSRDRRQERGGDDFNRRDRAGRFSDRFADRYSRDSRNSDENRGNREERRSRFDRNDRNERGDRFSRERGERNDRGGKLDRFGRVDYRNSWKTARGPKPKFHQDENVATWSREDKEILRENGISLPENRERNDSQRQEYRERGERREGGFRRGNDDRRGGFRRDGERRGSGFQRGGEQREGGFRRGNDDRRGGGFRRGNNDRRSGGFRRNGE